jgi:cytochrome c oxidase subunit 2
MLFNVEVVSQADYDTYIASLRAAGNEGQLDNEFDRNQTQPGTGAPTAQEDN